MKCSLVCWREYSSVLCRLQLVLHVESYDSVAVQCFSDFLK